MGSLDVLSHIPSVLRQGERAGMWGRKKKGVKYQFVGKNEGTWLPSDFTDKRYCSLSNLLQGEGYGGESHGPFVRISPLVTKGNLGVGQVKLTVGSLCGGKKISMGGEGPSTRYQG